MLYFLPLDRYISSATSPKDVVILIDTSGSMTGSRIGVAKHTVNTIMSTLGDDDFFNVISVSSLHHFTRVTEVCLFQLPQAVTMKKYCEN